MIKLPFKDYLLNIPKNIYLPSEDTYLLLEILNKENFQDKSSFLEMGSGSGILSLSVYDFFESLCLCDIDDVVINYLNNLKKEYSLKKIELIKSDLFKNIENKKFDVIVFNPPYVPSENLDVYSTDGGYKGIEVILKFIKNLKKYLTEKGVCYLLVSSHNDLNLVYNEILKNSLIFNILVKKKLFFEDLIILKICEK